MIGLTKVVAIAAGVYHALALKDDGTIWAWGFNLNGQLGNGSNTDSHVAIPVPGLSGITAIAAGYAHTFAMKNDSTGWAWGANNYGQLGNASFVNSPIPVQVSGLCAHLISVNEIGDPASISVFPNPSTGKFTISSADFISSGLVEILI